MQARAGFQRTIDQAIRKAPATITKQHRGQPSRRERRSFKAWTVSQLLETFRDPREILLEIASKDTAELAKEMNASLSDALAERRLCSVALLPYLCAKQPVAVDLRSSRTIHLNLVTEAQYQELQAVAEEPADDAESFSMQLIAASPAQETTTTQAVSETTDGVAQRGEKQSAERGERPVTPPVAADLPRSVKPESQWWDSVDGHRRQRLEDTPARAERDSWRRTHEGGVWPPDRSK
jgi:hypothetical protein